MNEVEIVTVAVLLVMGAFVLGRPLWRATRPQETPGPRGPSEAQGEIETPPGEDEEVLR